MQPKLILQAPSCAADLTTLAGSEYKIPGSGYIPPSYIHFGNIKICCKTGEVEGLSENISEDAQRFWDHIKEYIIGK